MSKSDIDSMLPEPIEVTIFNQTYRLRSKTDGEQVQQIARLVDERMRQISSQIITHDVVKIAILTALNIADEMQNLRNHYENEIQPLLSKTPEKQEEPEQESVPPDERELNRSKSWFEDFFDAEVEAKSSDERLSSQVSAKLRSLRQSGPKQMGITADDDLPG